MKRKFIIIKELNNMCEFTEKDDNGNIIVWETSKGLKCKFRYDDMNNMIYQEYNFNKGTISKTIYNTKGKEISTETISDVYYSNPILKDWKWQTIYDKSNNGTNAIDSAEDELIRYKAIIGNFWNKN